MARPILPDALWAVVEPVLPPHTPRPRGGRPPLSHRQALTGTLFVLRTGIPWEDLPAEMGCGSGISCWRQLERWQRDGTWGRLHAVLLDRLHQAGRIDWRRAAIDSSSVRAVLGGRGPAPTRRVAGTPAPSTTGWWMPPGCPWRPPCRPPAPTTCGACGRPRWRARGRATGHPAAAPGHCSGTGRIGRPVTRASSAGSASGPGSPAPARRTGAAPGSTAGWSSGRSPRSTGTAGGRCGTRRGRTPTRASSPAPAFACAGSASSGKVKASKSRSTCKLRLRILHSTRACIF